MRAEESSRRENETVGYAIQAMQTLQDHYELQTQRLNVAVEADLISMGVAAGVFIPNSKTANYVSEQTVSGQISVNQSNGDEASSVTPILLVPLP